MGHILGYTRLSTNDQDVTVQASRLNQSGAVTVFGDADFGRAPDRPGLDALLAAAQKGDTLAVVRLDRLGRSVSELLTTVAMLKERGIALVCLDESIDTRSEAGALIFHVFGALAHSERRLAFERMNGATAAGRARGERRGRPPLDRDKIRAALQLVESGVSPAAAARQLRLGRSTIYREVNRAGVARGSQEVGSSRSRKDRG